MHFLALINSDMILHLVLKLRFMLLTFSLRIYRLIHSAYSRPSSLFFGEETLQSSEGIAIHDIVQEVHSAFRVFYFDDGTLGGSVEEVLHDLSFVERSALDLGLHLNHDKSELICADTSATRDTMLSVAPSLRVQLTLVMPPFWAHPLVLLTE